MIVPRLLHEQGMLAESEELMLEVLEGRMTLLGESDPATLTTLNNLGGLPPATYRGLGECRHTYIQDIEIDLHISICIYTYLYISHYISIYLYIHSYIFIYMQDIYSYLHISIYSYIHTHVSLYIALYVASLPLWL